MRVMGKAFEPNGLNAIFAVVAAKVATLANGFDSAVASATAFIAMLYATVLLATAVVKFVKEVKGRNNGD